MKKWITAGTLLAVLAAALVLSGGRQQQGDMKMTFFFSGKVVETGEDYLRITVHDSGNSGFAENATVEVSAASAKEDVAAGEYARVLMDRRGEETERLEAYSVYRIDETGQALKN